METQNIRSREPLTSFIRYCVTHPEERFWQALRNWSGYSFVGVWDTYRLAEPQVIDTFYWEGKRHDGKES